MKKTLITLAAISTLSGCMADKSIEEKLGDACIDLVANNLEKYAKYDGWSVDNAKANLSANDYGKKEDGSNDYLKPIFFVPDPKLNAKYNSDMFHQYTVLVDNVKVVNGFGAKRKSIAMCKGVIGLSKKEGKWALVGDKVSTIGVKVTLDGKKLGY